MPKKLSAISIVLGVVIGVFTMESIMRFFFNEEEVPEANYVSVIPEGKTLHYCFEGCATSYWGPHGVRGLKGTIPANGILLIGSSFTASQQLDDGLTYADVMQSELKKNGIANQVLNIGKSAVSVPHYITFAKRNLELFKPAWTIIQLRDTDFTSHAWGDDPTVAQFYYEGGQLSIRKPHIFSEKEAIEFNDKNPSVVFAMASDLLKDFFRETKQKFQKLHAIHAPTQPNRPPPIVQEVDMLAEAYGNHFSILWLPRIKFSPPYIVDSEIRNTVRAFCQKKGIGFIEPAEDFVQLAKLYRSPYGQRMGYFNRGHLNQEGSQAVGVAAAQEIINLKKAHAIF